MKKLLILSLTLTSSIALASEVNVPNQFEDGQVTSAAQMNANFDAIQAAVNDNHARIESMQQPTKAVFQGFSTDSMNGGQGLIAMQQACHNFVPGSHICNTTEFAESPYNSSAVETMSGNAWILVDVVSDIDGRDSVTKHGYQIDKDDTSCDVSWGSGPIITSNGSVSLQSCDTINMVACCK